MTFIIPEDDGEGWVDDSLDEELWAADSGYEEDDWIDWGDD